MESLDALANDMNILTNRLNSFMNTSLINTLTSDIIHVLSRSGIYYSGRAKTLECHYCKRIWEDWNNILAVIDNHRLQSPNCAHYDNNNDGTINGGYGKQESVGVTIDSTRQPQVPTTSRRDGSSINHFPTDWQDRCPISARSLASAGLFYLGPGDRVKCFHCERVFHTWEPDDDPWEAHKRWSPNCEFINMMMKIPEDTPNDNAHKDRTINDTDEQIQIGVDTNAALYADYGVQEPEDQNSLLPDPNLMMAKAVRRTQADSLQWNLLTVQYQEIIALRKAKSKLQDENRDLAEKMAELKGRLKCFACIMEDRCVILPCEHFIICIACVPKVNHKCPICRRIIRDAFNIYHS